MHLRYVFAVIGILLYIVFSASAVVSFKKAKGDWDKWNFAVPLMVFTNFFVILFIIVEYIIPFIVKNW